MIQTHSSFSIRRSLLFSLTLMVFLTQILLPITKAIAVNTEFDGEYVGKLNLTVTATAPSDPPKVVTQQQSSDISIVVKDGKVIEAGQGGTIDSSGNALLYYDIPDYGTMNFKVHFTKGTSGKGPSVFGNINWTFNAATASIVLTGTFSGAVREKFTFTINQSAIHSARIGYLYTPVVSLCEPATKKGGQCGLFPTSKQRNPSGGTPPYSSKLRVGSKFLPTGLVLNASTGQISGTPIKGQATGPRIIDICVTDAKDRFTGVCRSVTLMLTK